LSYERAESENWGSKKLESVGVLSFREPEISRRRRFASRQAPKLPARAIPWIRSFTDAF